MSGGSVDHPRLIAVVRRAVASAHRPEPAFAGDGGEVPVREYTDVGRLAAERSRLFRRLPIPLAHASELSLRPGANTLVRELDGVSLLLCRGDDGIVRGFRNACRHRGVRLLREDCRAKALVCPYHGWTYGLDGALRHVPHLEAFPRLCQAERGLVPVVVEQRHGLVWAALDPAAPDVRAHLGEVDEELAALDLEHHVVVRRAAGEQRGNWKMLMEAFLEGYHIRTLHRGTVYPFFLDARSILERVGHHARAATARRAAKEVQDDASFAARPLRELSTPSYTIFPCTTFILHPDWTSVVVVQPLAPDRFRWSHSQLVAEDKLASDAARAHFERSFDLIEGNVFQKEDLLMVAEAQAGLETGANESLTFGRLESPALWFHDSIRELLDAP
jgi:phenylpropionate dioxygenase-like ring-hydroxylating dioxygenase large terminal subunit